MADYAAAPIQPIVQGLVTTVAGPPIVSSFFGRGVRKITRVAGPPISYRLVLDPGLPGNAGALEPLVDTVPPTPPVAPDPRTMIQLRSGPTVTAQVVTYAASSILVDGVAPPPDGSLNVVVITLIAVTPVDADFEIITWVGVDSAQL